MCANKKTIHLGQEVVVTIFKSKVVESKTNEKEVNQENLPLLLGCASTAKRDVQK